MDLFLVNSLTCSLYSVNSLIPIESVTVACQHYTRTSLLGRSEPCRPRTEKIHVKTTQPPASPSQSSTAPLPRSLRLSAPASAAMTPLALPRLVRNDPTARGLRSSKSAGELLPHAHAHSAADALPVFQRCASAEDSTGWVEHDEFLGQRHSTRRKRCAELVLPKLMSSFEDVHCEEEAPSPAAHTVGKLFKEILVPDEEILGTTTPAQDDMCPSALERGPPVQARRNRFFEPLNDRTGRPRRVFRKTPLPPTIRGVSTSGMLTGEEEGKVEKDACLRLQS